jgi:HAD superfamily hydrolase (TIGR01509 family)
MKYKCVIFDCDGVLVDSEGITAKVIAEITAELGVAMDEAFILDTFMGKSFNDIMRYLEIQISGSLPDNFEQHYRQKTFAAFQTDLKPIPGIHSVLENLEVPYCVASSGPSSKIRHNLSLTGLIEKFENHIFSCYDIQIWKPQPDIFLHAAQTMGFEPHECAVVEDSPIGVQAALAGGFDVFIYQRHAQETNSVFQTGVVFNQMEELQHHLKAGR